MKKQYKLKRKVSFSGRQLLFFGVIFAILAGYVIWRSFAAGPLQTLEAEQMVLSGNATRVADATASGGSVVQLTSVGSLASQTFYTTSDISSIKITAHGNGCHSVSSLLGLMVDNQMVFNNVDISSSSWVSHTAIRAFTGRTSHLIKVFRTTSNIQPVATSCNSLLYVDKVDINGPGPTVAAVNISASPSTVLDGQMTTLAWNSVNTTGSCTASGAWNGSKNQNGSATTVALAAANKAYTYNLVCSGPKGTTYTSTTVNVVNDSTLYGLPSATTLSRDPAAAASAPTNITSTGAVLWGIVNPNNGPLQKVSFASNYYFQYRTCTAKNPPPATGGSTGGCNPSVQGSWNSTPLAPVSSGTAPIKISYNLTGLSPGTAYIYRLIAVNPAGSVSDIGYIPAASLNNSTTHGVQSFYTASPGSSNGGPN